MAVIPARGGSKSIPRKNIRLLHEKPLIYYTIREALQSRYIGRVVVSTEDEEIYGYCTEFLIKGEELEPEIIKNKLKRKGKCLMVVGDDTTVRVHIHALNPGNVIHYAASLGTLHTVSLRNMDEQHEDFIALQKERMPTIDIAVVAIAAGDGLADVLTSLGASAIVPGGQTMNPSTEDIFQAAERVPSDKIIILPNNKNIIASAEQVASLTDKKIAVIPTRTIPQGVSALLAFDYEADFETNTKLMKEAVSHIKTIEITRANRSTRIDGLAITKKQAIGLFDGKLLAVSDKPIDVLIELFNMLDLEQTEVATIYYGSDTSETEAEEVSASIREKYHVPIKGSWSKRPNKSWGDWHRKNGTHEYAGFYENTGC